MTISAANKAIKIPAQHYVGFNKRGADEIPLGFATPDGADAAAIKRKQTVDDWADRSEIKIPAQTFENVALSGFKLSRSIKRDSSWGQGNVKWRIEDPRGFELEISSPNFSQIVSCSTLEQGEILDQCVWGRLGADNILIPVSSDVYKAATSNTERAGKKASMRDLRIGDHVVLQNGTSGRFLGNLFVVNRTQDFRLVRDRKRFILGTLDQREEITEIHAVGSPKLSEIQQGTVLSPEEAEQVANDAIAAHAKIETAGYSLGHAALVLDSLKVVYDFEQVTDYEAAKAILGKGYRYPHHILARCGDRWGIVDVYAYERSQQVEMTLIDNKLYLDQLGIRMLTQMKKYNSSYGGYPYGTTGGYQENIQYKPQPGEPVEWYLARANISTTAGYKGKVFY